MGKKNGYFFDIHFSRLSSLLSLIYIYEIRAKIRKGSFLSLLTSNFSIKIKDLTKALRYVPGHKHIILFSSGVASSVFYGIGAPFGSIRAGSFGNAIVRKRYEDMIKELAASNSIVYALNTEELRSVVHRDEEMMGVRSLQRFAKVTGGKYFDHIHNYENIMEEIQNLTSSYYVLGYYIDERWDGKYHKIKVKVKRKGCKVHAQEGYFNPKPFSKYTDLEKRLNLIDLALAEKPHFQFGQGVTPQPISILLACAPHRLF